MTKASRFPSRVRCPFCGNVIVDVRELGTSYWCQCQGCGARGPSVGDQRAAIDTWNGAEVRALTPKVIRERRPRLELVKPGCRCQACGTQFVVDLMVPDDMWEQIKPRGKPRGAGLLCPDCIIARVELISPGFSCWRLEACR